MRNPRSLRTALRRGATVTVAGTLALGLAAELPAEAQTRAQRNQAIARQLVRQHHWSDREFRCLVRLWNRESGWSTSAANSSGAYGIPQALPGYKMHSAGGDWRTSAKTQIKWGLGYVKSRYGSPCRAWSHSQATGWY